MEAKTVICCQCQKSYSGPSDQPFRVKCPNCNIIIEHTPNQPTAFYFKKNEPMPVNYVAGRASSARQAKQQLKWFGIIFLGVTVIITLLKYHTPKLSSDSNTKSSYLDSPREGTKDAYKSSDSNDKSTPAMNSQPTQQHEGIILASPKGSIDTTAKHSYRTLKSMASLIDSVGVTFNEEFEPIANVKLHNNTTKEISQVVFRFAFIAYNPSIGKVWDETTKDYFSYSLSTVNLAPGEYKTGHIQIASPLKKDFSTPIIEIIKVRFSDGTLLTPDE